MSVFKKPKKEKKEKEVKSGKNILPGVIIAGLFLSIIVYAVMINAEKNALTAYEKGTIYVAAKSIPKGTLINESNYLIYFSAKELDKTVIPKTAISTPEQLESLIACSAIDEGTLITRGMFESVNDVTKDMQEPVIAGFKADDLFQVVGGTLRAGDRIHIYSVGEEGITSLIWKDVFVEQVFDNTGVRISNENNEACAQRVNVYMDSKDVERFYSELAMGSLRAVKVCE